MEETRASIFAAEVRGKRPPSEISEDELTSRVLGLLAHLSPPAQMAFLGRLGLVEASAGGGLPDVSFWPRLGEAGETREPDAIIDLGGRRIVFEFKWLTEGSADQLQAEWRLLDASNDILAYVTRHSIRPVEADDAEEELGLKPGTIRWLSWNIWLKTTYETRRDIKDPRDSRLLEELIALLEVLGVSDWTHHLSEYWRIVKDENVTRAFRGLTQYFSNLRAYLNSKYGASHRVGNPETIFPEKSYVELTPSSLLAFDDSLGVWVIFDHPNQHWRLSLEGKYNLEPLNRAWKVLQKASLENVQLKDPRKNDYVVAVRPFRPSVGFEEPERLRDEIERALLVFGNDLGAALSK